MPYSPHTSRAPRRLIALLCAAALCCAPVTASARTDAEPTRVPQPTLDPNAEEYDDTMPEMLRPDQLIASSALLIEASSGEPVFEKNADEIMYPASTTKIITALIAIQLMERGDLPETVTVGPSIDYVPEDSSVIPISVGEEIDLRDLIYATMLRSGNDGSVAIAEHIAGSEAAFAQMMNDYAAFLGCTNTHFVNSHGYHDPDHYTTARDMALIAQNAMESPLFRDVVSTVQYSMPLTNMRPARNLTTNDFFINNLDGDDDYYFPGALGIKTGSHTDAMYCFVGAAERDGVELISVVFHSSDRGRWEDTRRLMEYGFTQFESTTPEDIYNQNPRILNISGFDLSDGDGRGELPLGIRAADPKRVVRIVGRTEEVETITNDFSRLTQVIINRSSAPVTQGEVMGTLTYYPRDGGPAEYELYATRSIEARKDAPPSLEEIERYTLEDPNPFPRFSIEYLVVPLIALLPLALLLRRLRGKHKRIKKQKRRLPRPLTRYYR